MAGPLWAEHLRKSRLLLVLTHRRVLPSGGWSPPVGPSPGPVPAERVPHAQAPGARPGPGSPCVSLGMQAILSRKLVVTGVTFHI